MSGNKFWTTSYKKRSFLWDSLALRVWADRRSSRRSAYKWCKKFVCKISEWARDPACARKVDFWMVCRSVNSFHFLWLSFQVVATVIRLLSSTTRVLGPFSMLTIRGTRLCFLLCQEYRDGTHLRMLTVISFQSLFSFSNYQNSYSISSLGQGVACLSRKYKSEPSRIALKETYTK